ncbi:hypothetical protein [Nocardia brasiliensis]|uniref:hypothetical protein n=1 Tax=Nocardia brasiliensis TaxID=37326 RepID=UPI0018952144|nr:hypothetical protein [Nocardia brasiliensis]MBF6125580.1 hypothetical protein [Nocardia brasiliensis]
MLDSRNTGPDGLASDPLSGLLDIRSAPMTFGYHERDEIGTDHSVEGNARPREKIGWWHRHRQAKTALGMAVALTLVCVPAAQTALLTVLLSTG